MSIEMQIFDDLAEMNLTVDEALQVTDAFLSQKEATYGLGDLAKAIPGMASGVTNAFKNITGGTKSLVEMSLPIALAAGAVPLFGGYTLGKMVADSMDVDKGDVADIQEQELINELQSNAEQIRRRTAMRAAGQL